MVPNRPIEYREKGGTFRKHLHYRCIHETSAVHIETGVIKFIDISMVYYKFKCCLMMFLIVINCQYCFF